MWAGDRRRRLVIATDFNAARERRREKEERMVIDRPFFENFNSSLHHRPDCRFYALDAKRRGKREEGREKGQRARPAFREREREREI